MKIKIERGVNLIPEVKEFINKSEEKLNAKQDILEKEKNRIIKFLEMNVLEKINLKKVMINARVKDKESLKEKIIRNNYYNEYKDNEEKFINELSDLIGVRFTCLLEKEESKLFSEIDKLFILEEENNFTVIEGTEFTKPFLKINKLNQPKTQKNSHNIYKLNCKWVTEEVGIINVELQIKSLVHMFWGEVEHALFYKNYAYNVGEVFYKDFMESTRKLLANVDSQLEIMHNHLSIKDEEQQIEEIKQMTTRLLYNNYHPKIIETMGFNIDLKEVYEIIVSMYFIGVDKREIAFTNMREIISTLNSQSGQLNEADFLIEDSYDRSKSKFSSEIKEFAIMIDKLVQEFDVFWKVLFAIYKKIFSPSTHTRAVDSLTESFLTYYEGFSDEFEGMTTSSQCITEGIQSGIIEAFSNYKKIDFFIANVYQEKIFNSLLDFIRDNQEDIMDISDTEIVGEVEDVLKKFVKFLTDLKIRLIINKQVEVNDLIEFQEFLNNQKLVWTPTSLDVEKLRKLIIEAKPISVEEFNLIL